MTDPTIGSFCTGIGGLDLAAAAHYNARHAWVCEYDSAPSKVLDHHWPDTLNHGDLTSTDWAAAEPVDIVTAGYPCQPFSTAGQRKGTDDERHIWPAIRDAISVLRPRVVVLENVRGHLSLGFDSVLGDLADLGFDAEWGTFRSSDVGAPHRRERLYVVASHPDSVARTAARQQRPGESERHGSRTDSRHLGTTTDTNSDPAGRHAGTTFGPQTWRENEQGKPDSYGSKNGRSATTDTDNANRRDSGQGLRQKFGGDRLTITDPQIDRFDGEREIGSTRRRRPRSTLGDATTIGPDRGSVTDWGRYGDAIHRWEQITGRPAPVPLTNGRLNPELTEWMMGYPAGWVTDPAIGLSWAQQLKACGNAVQPQTAALALDVLSERLAATDQTIDA
jgi:DNA (cytosine-5)-methyltransferase 1